MHIEFLEVETLVPYIRNLKTHPKGQIEKIGASIEAFGFRIPLLVDEALVIISGEGRLLAAKHLGMAEVPCIRISDLTPEQVRAFRMADNKVAESDFNLDEIARELKELVDLDFDLELTGFDCSEIDGLIGDLLLESGQTDPDAVPKVDEDEAHRCQAGDLWILGDHRLLCGDAVMHDDFLKLMDGELAHMVFTDPPYNVDYTGGTEKRLKIENDKLTDQKFYDLLFGAFTNMFEHTVPGGGVYVCHSDAEWKNFREALANAGWIQKQCLIWVKNGFVLGRQDYHSRHEPILYGWKPGAAHRWFGGRKQQSVTESDPLMTIAKEEDGQSILTFTDGVQHIVVRVPDYELLFQGGDALTSIWKVAKPLKNGDHPTMKPVALIERAIRNSSKRGEIVLDCFGGSGSTLIACEQTGRRCRTMELGTHYCQVIVKRWEAFTGKKAEVVRI